MSAPSPSTRPSARAPERRVHRRVGVGAAAWLLLEEQRVAASCQNVSMGGAAVHAEVQLATGRLVRLELSLGSDRPSVSIQCEVVRASGSELGLRFTALDRASLEAILALL